MPNLHICCEFVADEGMRRPLLRYNILNRLQLACKRRNVQLLAFGFHTDELRLILDGAPADAQSLLRGLKSGTTRVANNNGVHIVWCRTECIEIPEEQLTSAIAWAHRAGVDAGGASPLSSPWTSHRDLLQFRRASFYDASVLAHRVEPREVHRQAGGLDLPAGWPPAEGHESLNVLIRIAAATLGVLPAHRAGFRLFAHLCRDRGHDNDTIAHALCLTSRRVRQLIAQHEPLLSTAKISLNDPRLMCLP